MPAATPGRAASLTAISASNDPRSLKIRAMSPSTRPRAAASPGFSVTRRGPARFSISGMFAKVLLRK